MMGLIYVTQKVMQNTNFRRYSRTFYFDFAGQIGEGTRRRYSAPFFIDKRHESERRPQAIEV